MTRTGLFYDLISTIFERGSRRKPISDARSLESLCKELLTSQGEVSGHLLGQLILDKFDLLADQDIFDFFMFLTEELDVDVNAVLDAASQYRSERSTENLSRLTQVSEPPRQELLRRINQVPGATEKLVQMRNKLLYFSKKQEAFRRTDLDFQHLFSSWFNSGFLVLRRIQWQSPASVLQKIIEYEAVHAIDDWDDLRRRVEPEDRRCYAFFHPSMPDDPLIFVEVALCKGALNSIQGILASEREILVQENADTAVFYSISNCQSGLRGVSFGNSLIKQVVQDLQAELAHLKTFITLSPIPGFCSWMLQYSDENNSEDDSIVRAIEVLEAAMNLQAEEIGDGKDIGGLPEYGEQLRKLAAWYLYKAKDAGDQPLDPVAKFHLYNGALLHDVHAGADTSQNGIRQSASVMVNYLYDLERVEQNHEEFATNKKVAVSKAIRNLASQFSGKK